MTTSIDASPPDVKMAVGRIVNRSTAKSLLAYRGDAGNAEVRGGFLLNLSAFPLRPLRLRGEIDLFAVESSITPQKGPPTIVVGGTFFVMMF
jgi:hypothetical protein